MFILCVTKGQKILFLFKDEELSSIHILNDERVFFIAQPITVVPVSSGQYKINRQQHNST